MAVPSHIPRKWYELLIHVLPVLRLLVLCKRSAFTLTLIYDSSVTNRLISAKDYTSVQISVGIVGPDGILTGEVKPYAISGLVRTQGGSDAAINYLVKRDNLM